MSDEYTPSAEKLQEAYEYWVAGLGGSDGREVERFLAAHDKALREQIAQEIESTQLGREANYTDPLPYDYSLMGQSKMRLRAARLIRKGAGNE